MTLDTHYNVVVIGAGPGGSFAAMTIARSGHSVLLAEKRKVIGSPVRCAEGMTDSMFRSAGLKIRPHWVVNRLDGAELISPSGHTMKIHSDDIERPIGYMLDREIFDMDLAIDAADAGACVQSDCTIKRITRSEDLWTVEMVYRGRSRTITTDVIIGADGFESQVGRWAGIDTLAPLKDVLSGIEYTLTGLKEDRSVMEFHFDHDHAPGGYAWVFWKGPGVANVGVGVPGDRLSDPGQMKNYLDSFIASRSHIKNGKVSRVISGGIPCTMPMKKISGDGIMLVGDAARVTDPLHGGGISNAIITGRLAGQCAVRSLEEGTLGFDVYEKEWRMILEADLYKHYLIKEYISKLDNNHLDIIMETLSTRTLDVFEPSVLINYVADRYPEMADRLPRVVF